MRHRRIWDREHDFTDEDREKAWKVVDEAVKTYSDEMVQRWITEMDTLLVYVRLHIQRLVERKILTISHHRRACSPRYSLPSTSNHTRCCRRRHQTRYLLLSPKYPLNSQAFPSTTDSSTLHNLRSSHRFFLPTLPPRSNGPYGSTHSGSRASFAALVPHSSPSWSSSGSTNTSLGSLDHHGTPHDSVSIDTTDW